MQRPVCGCRRRCEGPSGGKAPRGGCLPGERRADSKAGPKWLGARVVPAGQMRMAQGEVGPATVGSPGFSHVRKPGKFPARVVPFA